MTRLAFRDVRLLDPAARLDARGGLLVEDGRIADFGPGLFADGAPEGATVVDGAGLCLAPGLVDMRVQSGEPGEEHKETLASLSRAAFAGGVTTVVCLPNVDPPLDTVAAVEFLLHRGREPESVRIHPYGALTKRLEGREMAEIGLLQAAGAVAFTDGDRAVADALLMRRVLAYAGSFGALVVQHPEEPRLAEGGAMNAGELATRLGLAGIPPQAEVMTIERDLRLVEMTGGRYHVAHVSTRAAVEAIRAAKARGLRVTCDTAPFYFGLNETAVADYRTFAKLSPPLRDEYDRLGIVEGLADGTIDAIASDHRPQDQDAKRLPFPAAAFGAVGLETLLPLTLELVHNGALTPLDALALVTCRPAELLGLPYGKLARGAPADLVLFDFDRPWAIDADRFHGKSRNTPFDRRPVSGRVLRTWRGGELVFDLES